MSSYQDHCTKCGMAFDRGYAKGIAESQEKIHQLEQQVQQLQACNRAMLHIVQKNPIPWESLQPRYSTCPRMISILKEIQTAPTVTDSSLTVKQYQQIVLQLQEGFKTITLSSDQVQLIHDFLRDVAFSLAHKTTHPDSFDWYTQTVSGLTYQSK